MRNLVLLAFVGSLLYSPARAEVLYVRPDDAPTTAQYRWHDEVIRDAVPVRSAIGIAKRVGGSRPIEIRLLRQDGVEETLYSVDLSSYRSALRWNGSAEKHSSLALVVLSETRLSSFHPLGPFLPIKFFLICNDRSSWSLAFPDYVAEP
jgi:hypothetical protein